MLRDWGRGSGVERERERRIERIESIIMGKRGEGVWVKERGDHGVWEEK